MAIQPSTSSLPSDGALPARREQRLRFDSSKISGLFLNERDIVGETFRGLALDARVVLATGYGVREGRMPVRVLSYAVPLLRLLPQLPAQMTGELYVALNGVIRANSPSANPSILAENASTAIKLVSAYAQRFHPSVANRVRVLCDAPLLDNSELKRWRDDVTAGAVREILATDEALRSFVMKRGGERPLTYFVEHAIYMRDPLTAAFRTQNLVPEARSDFDTVIMVGGPAEKLFFRFREALRARLNAPPIWDSKQIFTPIGDPPAYHLQDGEPQLTERADSLPSSAIEMLREVSQRVDQMFARNIMRDLILLCIDASGFDTFPRFGPKLHAHQLLDESITTGVIPEYRKLIELGWTNLRQFIGETL